MQDRKGVAPGASGMDVSSCREVRAAWLEGFGDCRSDLLDVLGGCDHELWHRTRMRLTAVPMRPPGIGEGAFERLLSSLVYLALPQLLSR
ncbi:hypothetical protein AJ87_36495 [Rhizobium yanglingense]|nr:hypothetical protein AJ87_36495 [Rhizobium yanglingense]